MILLYTVTLKELYWDRKNSAIAQAYVNYCPSHGKSYEAHFHNKLIDASPVVITGKMHKLLKFLFSLNQHNCTITTWTSFHIGFPQTMVHLILHCFATASCIGSIKC